MDTTPRHRFRVMLADNDKPHRCPAWSRKPLGCPGGSFAAVTDLLGDFGRNPNHLLLRCRACGTWRLPTVGLRLPFERAAWRLSMWRHRREQR